jgi:predicted dehydrogenase
MTPARLMTLDPGHFHAALVQKEMYPGVDPRVHVYAPLGPDLVGHLNRIIGFNTRRGNPTAWETEIHAVAPGADPLERMLAERPGNVVVLSGRNNVKIDRIKAAVEAGLHVLSDKPWIIEPENFGKLQSALDTAAAKGLIAFDMMTERFEITSILCRDLVNDPEVFGRVVPGSLQEPAVSMTSTHYLMKLVAGVPNRRPAWYFDTRIQGEGLADVGTHLVDIVPWTVFPGQAMDWTKDVALLAATRRPTKVSKADFARVTGEADFPASVAGSVTDGVLDYYCNTYLDYSIRGVHVHMDVLWDFEQPVNEGDTYMAAFRGDRSRVEIRQTREQGWKPELYVIPHPGTGYDAVIAALSRRLDAVQGLFPGVGLDVQPGQARLTIPDQYRVGHEAHFASVTKAFLGYLREPATLPAWERPNMLAKYRVTTGGVELSRKA